MYASYAATFGVYDDAGALTANRPRSSLTMAEAMRPAPRTHRPAHDRSAQTTAETVRDINELRGDTDSSAGSPHTALENGVDAERFCDLPDRQLLPFERERRGSCNHFQPRHVSECIDDLFSQSVAEVFLFGLGAEVRERQDGD